MRGWVLATHTLTASPFAKGYTMAKLKKKKTQSRPELHRMYRGVPKQIKLFKEPLRSAPRKKG